MLRIMVASHHMSLLKQQRCLPRENLDCSVDESDNSINYFLNINDNEGTVMCSLKFLGI